MTTKLTNRKFKILIIEDNEDTQLFLKNILSKDYDLSQAENAVVGIEMARNEIPDLIILDIMLPILDGFEACKILKQDTKTAEIPILFLSAKGQPDDISNGLDLGADDYLPKPFDLKVLRSRIEARLRQQSKIQSTRLIDIKAGDLTLNLENRDVFFKKTPIKLTSTEFDILKILVDKRGITVSREQILEILDKDKESKTNDRTIDVHIRSIRKKIQGITKYLTSEYGSGYRFEV